MQQTKEETMMMEFLLMIFGACLIGLGVGLMFHNKKSEAKKPWKPKKKTSFWVGSAPMGYVD